MEWEFCFIKDYMSINKDFLGIKIIESVTFLVLRIAKKNRWNGPGIKFISRMVISIGLTSNDFKVRKIRGCFIKDFIWGFVMESGGRKSIDDICGS